ncbi:hypothetical protein GCM10023347_16510 [Streptomyces chumphonensis]
MCPIFTLARSLTPRGYPPAKHRPVTGGDGIPGAEPTHLPGPGVTRRVPTPSTPQRTTPITPRGAVDGGGAGAVPAHDGRLAECREGREPAAVDTRRPVTAAEAWSPTPSPVDGRARVSSEASTPVHAGTRQITPRRKRQGT